jgi:predicted Fe-S protein YdhL (DUF1289 family)
MLLSGSAKFRTKDFKPLKYCSYAYIHHVCTGPRRKSSSTKWIVKWTMMSKKTRVNIFSNDTRNFVASDISCASEPGSMTFEHKRWNSLLSWTILAKSSAFLRFCKQTGNNCWSMIWTLYSFTWDYSISMGLFEWHGNLEQSTSGYQFPCVFY